MVKRKFAFLFFFFGFLIFFFFQQENIFKTKSRIYVGKIERILEEKEFIVSKRKNLNQKLKIKIIRGELVEKTLIVENQIDQIFSKKKYQEGDYVIITKEKINKQEQYRIKDYYRLNHLILLFGLFFLLTLLITGNQGVMSFIGMAYSFFIIFSFIFPRIASGVDPLQTVILGSLVTIPLTFCLSHGLNKKTVSAIFGTLISLILTIFFAFFFIDKTKITGDSSETINFLQLTNKEITDIQGLIIAGIIISAIGIFDDVNISQAGIVFKIKEINKEISFLKLFKKAMEIGRDHIASTVNTLVFVYAGASMPLLLLFFNTQLSFFELINEEIVAEEIVKILLASTGLILSVPITTLIASYMATSD
ncbi:MAG: YibE/F family protein [Patescibacteria group bacterium]|nr:YibE/F family protein [Patescibacteria group bacterium]